MNMDNIDNALVRQKNHILTLINDEKYEEAMTLLDFSADLWATCSYTYKTAELRNRIKAELENKQLCCGHWKQHEKWGKMLAQVELSLYPE